MRLGIIMHEKAHSAFDSMKNRQCNKILTLTILLKIESHNVQLVW